MDMIIDFFPFSGAGNELDILEIRLNELNSIVDFFLLAEWTDQPRQESLWPVFEPRS